MRPVILYIAASLDGYIARDNDAIDFLSGHTDAEVDYGYDQFLSTIDTVILGSRTYIELIQHLSMGAWPYADKKSYVFSNRLSGENEEVEFVKGDVVEFVKTLKKTEGQGIWIVGGRGVIDPLIEANLIDRYVITFVPYIIGSGKRLFSTMETQIPLKLISAETYNGMVMLTYEKR